MGIAEPKLGQGLSGPPSRLCRFGAAASAWIMSEGLAEPKLVQGVFAWIMSEGWCERGDSNPHDLAIASPSSWCVCQFRHFR